MFGYANRFVFANVACYAAQRILPSGANAHCTIRPPKWWRKIMSAVGARYPGVRYEIRLQETRQDPGKVIAG
jgi:hypothetical protein